MKLLKLELGEQFRSLHKGFNLEFHKLTSKGYSSMMEFQPFCFAGLNGSGKSNVLEALASIFYHLEFCVAKFRPISFEKHFDRKKSTPDIYKLEYLISNKDDGKNILTKLEIPENIRGEKLTTEQFAQIADEIYTKINK